MFYEPGSVWTPERDAKLAALYEQPIFYADIAKQMAEGDWRPSSDAIRNRAQKLRIKRPSDTMEQNRQNALVLRADAGGWTEERIAVLTRLYANGLSSSQIAKQLGGVSRNAVIGKIHRLGLSNALRQTASAPPTPRPPKPPPKPKAVRMPPTPDGPSVPTQEPTEGAKTLLDLERHECRWAVAGDGAETLFCCKPVWWKSGEATPWCPTHYRRAYDLTKRLQPPNVYDPSVKRTAKPDPVLRRASSR